MWKRLNPRDRQPDRTAFLAESPSLIETTADHHTLQSSPIINNGSFSLSPRPAFGRKGTADVLKGLPAVPLSDSLQIPGVHETQRPSSEVPTASSIYSQPSTEMNDNTIITNGHPLRSSSLYPEDVSPPESLHTIDGRNGGYGRDSSDVSPISDTHSSSARPRSPTSTLGRFNSNLPVPKKTRKFWNRPSTETPEKGSSTTHWDVYSGEPTTSERGKPPSTTPSAVKLHADPSLNRLDGFGISTHISGGSPDVGSIRRKRVASRDSSNNPILRPEWKGAGGRHKIVNPLLDKPLPLGISPSFPAGSEKHHQEQRERERVAQERTASRSNRRSSVPHGPGHITQMHQPSINLENEALDQNIGPLDRKEDSPSDLTPPASQHHLPLRESSLTAEDIRSPLARNPSNEEFQDPRSQALPSLPQSTATEEEPSPWQARNPSNEDFQDRRLQALPSLPQSTATERDPSPWQEGTSSNEDFQDQRSQALPNLPQSTATERDPSPWQNVEDSPLQSVPSAKRNPTSQDPDSGQIESKFRTDLEHMRLQEEPRSRFSATTYATTTCDSPPATPEIGSNSPSISSTPNSILNRKRPVAPAGLPNSRATARKPTPSEMSVTAQQSPLPPLKASESMRKALPKSPPEVNAVSRVASLQAKLDNLKRRKNNLQTVIHELTHVVQPSSIAYDMASRQEIKRTVEGLNKELADVLKDEHETGLKLHRAKKRDDEFAAYEPTSLWVRRVTS